jgi:hypothetical protein
MKKGEGRSDGRPDEEAGSLNMMKTCETFHDETSGDILDEDDSMTRVAKLRQTMERVRTKNIWMPGKRCSRSYTRNVGRTYTGR